jgi:hypothetical protein
MQRQGSRELCTGSRGATVAELGPSAVKAVYLVWLMVERVCVLES